MENFDVLIVGCGITGASIARKLADENFIVKIIDRRDHIGGNMYDYVDEHGILVHKYGSHIFHTYNKKLFDYVNKYSEWNDYHITCGAEINGKCTPTPFNFKTIDDFYEPDKAEELKRRIINAFPGRKSATVLEVLSCDDKMVSEYAQFLFDNDYSLYTAKQWGIPASDIDPSVLKRVPLKFNYEDGYFDDPYQIMPAESYTDFFKALLDHPNISVQLNTDASDHLSIKDNILFLDGEPCDKYVVYTGALDELFEMQFDALPYRSLEFKWEYEDIDSKQDMAIVAYPQVPDFIRIVEFKKLNPERKVRGTSYEIEYSLPYKKGVRHEPFYPVLTDESKIKYKKYKDLANAIPNLIICGRLADFKYYNMDQALDNALNTADKLIGLLKK